MNYEDMHWKTLKSTVEANGGVYVNKEDAVKFMNELMGSTKSPETPDTKTAVAELDKSKPYGEISGSVEGAPGARFIQGGVYFNSKGQKVG